ncbi:MAG: hypothetical protein ACOC3S_03505, partial [Bacteroidota bacterium]
FYDVTTIYFDSQKETPGSKKKKGYSKDKKAHKTQIVLGLFVDKLRNPVTYYIYEGNTYEEHTMIDALKDLKKEFNIDRVIAVSNNTIFNQLKIVPPRYTTPQRIINQNFDLKVVLA